MAKKKAVKKGFEKQATVTVTWRDDDVEVAVREVGGVTRTEIFYHLSVLLNSFATVAKKSENFGRNF